MTKFYLYDVHENLKQRPVFVYEITAAPVEHWTLVSKHDTEKDAVDALEALRPVADIDDKGSVFHCACAMVVEYDVDQDGTITEDLGTVAYSVMPPLPMTFEAYGAGNTLYLPRASAIISASCQVPDDCENEDYGYFAMKNAILAALSKDLEGSALVLSFPYDDAPESSFSPDAYADVRVDVDLCFF